MPYMLSNKGKQLALAVEAFDERDKPLEWATWNALTHLQREAIDYLAESANAGRYIASSEVASFHKLAPQAMRGPMWWLYKKGLLVIEN